jgi:hypothetical protein
MADFNQAGANEVIQRIGEAVTQDASFSAVPWQGIALVPIIGNGARQLSGYWYAQDGSAEPELPADRSVSRLFLDLQQATAVPGKGVWKTCLFKIRRNGMRMTVDFDYDNPLRWKVTPGNMDTLVPGMRPDCVARDQEAVAALSCPTAGGRNRLNEEPV